MRRWLIYSGCFAAAVGVLFAAAPNRDLKLGRSIETMADIMRDVSLYYVDETDPSDLLNYASHGLTLGLDRYTEFMPAEEMDDFAAMTTGEYGGIGAVVRKKGNYVAVAQPYEGSPADRAGLVAGDRFVAIDSVNVVGATTEQVSKLLRGTAGTKFTARVLRLVGGQEDTITITRERIEIPAVPYHNLFEGGIGYIRHADFSDGSAGQMRRALSELRERGPLKGLILDYRGNGGGILQEAVEILSMFVPRGTEVVSTRGRREEMNEIYITTHAPVDTQVPIVVLADRRSASASEIVAGALQDLGRAVIMGQRTFGKGRVQITRPVGYGSYLKVTAAKYYLPGGQCVDSIGVAPDIALEPEFMSDFAATVYARGYISDFADDLIAEDPDTRHLHFGMFATWLTFKDFEYQSPTRRIIEDLKERAKYDLQLEALAGSITELESQIKDDMESVMRLNEEQVQELLNEELVMRREYARGAAKYALEHDAEFDAALELLRDGKRYNEIFGGR